MGETAAVDMRLEINLKVQVLLTVTRSNCKSGAIRRCKFAKRDRGNEDNNIYANSNNTH